MFRCVLVVIFVLKVDLILAQTLSPAVVWDIEVLMNQTGWNGLGDPNHLWGSQTYAKTISNGRGGFAANTISQEWIKNFSARGNYGTSQGKMEGRLTPGALYGQSVLLSNTPGADFVIEEGLSRMLVRAWVRASPGEQYRVEMKNSSDWRGQIQEAATIQTIASSRQSIEYGQGGRNVFVFSPHETSNILTVPVGSPTVVFDEYPNIVYSQVQFPQFGGQLLSYDESKVSWSAAESCIIQCGLPTFVNGVGSSVNQYNVSLLSGLRPDPQFGIKVLAGFDPTDNVLNIDVARSSITFESESIDPDDGLVPGNGLLHYEWFVNNQLFQAGDATQFAWNPSQSGTYSVRLEVTDNEGMVNGLTKDFTVAAIPEPSSASLLTIAFCGIVATLRSRGKQKGVIGGSFVENGTANYSI